MPVELLPPVSSSLGLMQGKEPLYSGPAYLRTRGMSRWHRPRSGCRYVDRRAVSYTLWCGQSAGAYDKAGGLLEAEVVPAGEEACGACVGRAMGAGQMAIPAGLPPMRFDPRWLTPPRKCPGSNSLEMALEPDFPSIDVAVCLACGVVGPLRASGSVHRASYGVKAHPPGSGLVDPCPFHAWMYIGVRGEVAGCTCGWHDKARSDGQ